jgi:hypothetical protein
VTTDPIILHGARVYPRVSRRHGVKHSASSKPLDRNRSRPCGWWMHDEETGLRHGIVETLRGHNLTLDGLELDELVRRTVEAVA